MILRVFVIRLGVDLPFPDREAQQGEISHVAEYTSHDKYITPSDNGTVVMHERVVERLSSHRARRYLPRYGYMGTHLPKGSNRVPTTDRISRDLKYCRVAEETPYLLPFSGLSGACLCRLLDSVL